MMVLMGLTANTIASLILGILFAPDSEDWCDIRWRGTPKLCDFIRFSGETQKIIRLVLSRPSRRRAGHEESEQRVARSPRSLPAFEAQWLGHSPYTRVSRVTPGSLSSGDIFFCYRGCITGLVIVIATKFLSLTHFWIVILIKNKEQRLCIYI